MKGYEVDAWRTWPLPEVPTTLRRWQEGRCAWCADDTGRVVRDHCHETGMVRGLLCDSCNQRESKGDGGWDAWRAGDHPAAAISHIEVYVSTVGLTPLEPMCALSYYTYSEREAWWEATTADLTAGGAWPTSAPWSDKATARRDADLASMREAMNRLPMFGATR